MSVWNPPRRSASARAQDAVLPKVTVPSLLERKRCGAKISAVTAYDFPSARLADAAGLDLILVGDSLAMTMLGHESTLAVTMDEMLVFTRAVRRGVQRALLVADMPFGSYQADDRAGVENAIRFVKEAGAEAVKLEGSRISLVERLVEAEIPVMGHLGLTPQAVNRMGGYKVQAKTRDAIGRLRDEAHGLAEAGCFSIVLEGIPREVAAELTADLTVPTIGIGAGPACDGQILVWHDLLGFGENAPAKFVRQYLRAAELIGAALEHYVADVRAGVFPADAESYHLPAEKAAAVEELASSAR
jgi:3-methyl-2-oxobutanoate hydroxymethyltransferase